MNWKTFCLTGLSVIFAGITFYAIHAASGDVGVTEVSFGGISMILMLAAFLPIESFSIGPRGISAEIREIKMQMNVLSAVAKTATGGDPEYRKLYEAILLGHSTTVERSRPGMKSGDGESLAVEFGRRGIVKIQDVSTKDDNRRIVVPNEEYGEIMMRILTQGPVE